MDKLVCDLCHCYNWTLLELKCMLFFVVRWMKSERYNWTLLELKSPKVLRAGSVASVIIEPYWNWNLHNSCRSIMNEHVIIEPYWNWNWCLAAVPNRRCYVIIEPYWNWNNEALKTSLPLSNVIIEPYWNWNEISVIFRSLSFCYNWTLLELK